MAARTLDSYAPFDSGAGANVTEDTWRSMMRQALPGDGVLWYKDNEMKVFADSTGMQVKVPSGQVWIEGHWGQQAAQQSYAVTAAHATLGRIDSVVARADFVNNRIEIDVLAGTAAASPAQPTLTQNSSIWEIPLANITVAAAAVTLAAGTVTDKRQFTGPWGIRPMAHVGRTAGFQTLSTFGSTVQMSAAQFQQGCTFVDANDSIRIDRRGRYRVTAQVYFTGGTPPYNGQGFITKNYNTDNVNPPAANVISEAILWKQDANDYAASITAIVDLELNDEIRLYETTGTASKSTWGTNGYTGAWFEVEYVGQSS